MSNCVEIYTNISISNKEFDIDKLFNDMDKHDYVNESTWTKHFAPEATNAEFYFYWFIGEDNFRRNKNNLVISLGHHRSTHTNRDLKGLESFLAQYLLVDEIKCNMCMGDEYDGFKLFNDDFVITKKSFNV